MDQGAVADDGRYRVGYRLRSVAIYVNTSRAFVPLKV